MLLWYRTLHYCWMIKHFSTHVIIICYYRWRKAGSWFNVVYLYCTLIWKHFRSSKYDSCYFIFLHWHLALVLEQDSSVLNRIVFSSLADWFSLVCTWNHIQMIIYWSMFFIFLYCLRILLPYLWAWLEIWKTSNAW